MTKAAVRLAGAALAAGTVFVTAGCTGSSGGNGGSTTATSPTITKSSTSPTPKEATATATSSSSASSDPLAKNKTAAIAAVVAFWKKVDQLDALPLSTKADLTSLNQVARGQVLAQYQYNISSSRELGETVKGTTLVDKPSAKATSSRLTYKVTACIDVSKTKVYKHDKPEPVPSGAPSRTTSIYGVTQDAKTDKWYVTTEKQPGTC